MPRQGIFHFGRNFLEDLAMHDPIRLQFPQLLNQHLLGYGSKFPAQFSVPVGPFEKLIDDDALPTTAYNAH